MKMSFRNTCVTSNDIKVTMTKNTLKIILSKDKSRII